MYRAKWYRHHFGSYATDLRHGMACASSGGGKARDWMLDPPKPVMVDFDKGIDMMAAQINAFFTT